MDHASRKGDYRGQNRPWGGDGLPDPAEAGKGSADPPHPGNPPEKAVYHHRAGKEILREEARRILELSKIAEELL